MDSISSLKTWLKDQYGIVFRNEHYLVEALTHSSYANEKKYQKQVYNERIEFLGDAVLELFISNWMYRNLPQLKEGQLTRLRAQIVCEESLSLLTKECQLDRYILLGKGEEATGGRTKPAILCDLFEAFIGAIYLDKGFEEVSKFLGQVIITKIQNGRFALAIDYKTDLQEYFQKDGAVKIFYELLSEDGPSHEKYFTVRVHVEDTAYEMGTGKTKKTAEQEAAKRTLEALHVIG